MHMHTHCTPRPLLIPSGFRCRSSSFPQRLLGILPPVACAAHLSDGCTGGVHGNYMIVFPHSFSSLGLGPLDFL